MADDLALDAATVEVPQEVTAANGGGFSPLLLARKEIMAAEDATGKATDAAATAKDATATPPGGAEARQLSLAVNRELDQDEEQEEDEDGSLSPIRLVFLDVKSRITYFFPHPLGPSYLVTPTLRCASDVCNICLSLHLLVPYLSICFFCNDLFPSQFRIHLQLILYRPFAIVFFPKNFNILRPLLRQHWPAIGCKKNG